MKIIDILEDKKKELWNIRLSLKNNEEIKSFDVAINRVLAEIKNDPAARDKFWVQEKEILKKVKAVFIEKNAELIKQKFLFEEMLDEKKIDLPKGQLAQILEWIESLKDSTFYVIGKSDSYPIQFLAKNVNTYDKLYQLFKGIDDSKFSCEFVVFEDSVDAKDFYENWDEFYPVEYQIDQLSKEFSRTENSKMYEYANGNYDFDEDWINDPRRGDLIKNFKAVDNFRLPYETELYLNPENFLVNKLKIDSSGNVSDIEKSLIDLIRNRENCFVRFHVKNKKNEVYHFDSIFDDRSLMDEDIEEFYLEFLHELINGSSQNDFKLIEIQTEKLETIHYFLSYFARLSAIKGAREIFKDMIVNPESGTLIMFDDAGRAKKYFSISYDAIFDGAYEKILQPENLEKIDSWQFISNIRNSYESNTEQEQSLGHEIHNIQKFLKNTNGILVSDDAVSALLNFKLKDDVVLVLSDSDGNEKRISKENFGWFSEALEAIRFSKFSIEFIEIEESEQKKLNAPESPDQS